MAAPFNADEVVREGYFINESERDSGTPANDAGKVPQLEDDGRLHREFLQNINFMERTTFDVMNGSVTPVPVSVTNRGLVASASAAANSINLKTFFGFVLEDYSGNADLSPIYLSGATNASATHSLTANAGEDRIILIAIESTAVPSGVTWNGLAMSQVDNLTDFYSSSLDMSLWVLAIGDSLTNQTANVVITGATGLTGAVSLVYGGVDQVTPYGDTSKGSSAGTAISVVTEVDDGYGRTAAFYINSTNGQVDNLPAGFTVRQNMVPAGGSRIRGGDFRADDLDPFTGGTNNFYNAAITVGLNSSLSPHSAILQYTGIVSGFSGLTINALYYLSNTQGQISTTPGTNSVLVGRAISSTELLILR